MTRLVLISDLHFGRADPDLVAPLARAVRAASPDHVVVAGDFVQRARGSHFREAHSFMEGLRLPWSGVPGNHDIPLFNVFLRLVDPYRPYRRWISDDRTPRVELDDVVLLGLDTSDPCSHQRGHISKREIARIADGMAETEDRLPVIVAHHPFHQAPELDKTLMRNAETALEAWSACRPHMILSGHLHQWLFEPFLSRKGSRTLQLHCGTAVSSRRRGHSNDFAVLDCRPHRVTATRMIARDRRFEPETAASFVVADGRWQSVAAEERVPDGG